MSTVLKPIIDIQEVNAASSNILKISSLFYKNNSKNHKKLKENYFKHKCSKVLKNKLKKYKIRHDGKDDPEVLNVSHTFQCSLRIKSPNHNNNTKEFNLLNDELIPTNYLFKMVRRKRDVENSKAAQTLFKEVLGNNTTVNQVSCAEMDHEEILTPNSQDKTHTNVFKLMMESRNKSIGGNSPGKERTIDESELQIMEEEKKTKAKRLLILQKMAEAKGSLKKKEKEEALADAINKKMEKRAERLTNMIVKSKKTVRGVKDEPILVTTEMEERLPALDKEVANGKQVLNVKSHGTLNLINMFEEPVQIKTNLLKEKEVPKEDLEFLKKLSPSIKKKENMLCYFKKLDKDDESFPPSTNEEVEQSSPIIKVKFSSRNKKQLKKNKLSLQADNTCENKNKNICNESKLEKQLRKKKTNIQTDDSDDTCDTKHENLSNENKLEKPLRKKKLSLQTNNICEIKNENICNENKLKKDMPKIPPTVITNNKRDTRKRKREQIIELKHIGTSEECGSHQNECKTERPKRNIKKPTQYNDDFVLSSSDEEYHIFTPKKKKHIDKKMDTPKLSKGLKTAIDNVIKSDKKHMKDNNKSANNSDIKKRVNVKLAPIFAPKPQLDQAALEAKQKFLQSGVPEKLKKVVSQQKQIDAEMNSFFKVVHVQQTGTTGNTINNNIPKDLLKCDSDADFSPVKSSEKRLNVLLSPEKPSNYKQLTKADNNVHKILKNIKLSYPKFPVYRTYHILKAKSKGELTDSHLPELDNSVEIINNVTDFSKLHIDKLNWTDKYKPLATNQIMGNFETTKELKKWLESWSANESKGKANDKDDSDSSDFCYSDQDSRDSMKTTDNLLILTGPTGCGKTSCVYAVAAELSIKVIEVNASSKRNGKIMLQDLQEATQSHKVNRGKGSSAENSQKSQDVIDVDFLIKTKKRGRPKKLKDLPKTKNDVFSQPTNSQDNARTGMSLILIDDADIVFEQDDGFCSAISQLIQYSKRPVILITTSLVCPHLQRFVQSGKIMKMKPLLPRMLGTWLDIMCLADGGTCWPGLGSVLLDLFKGDIRKTINCIQFYANTYIQHEFTQLDDYTPNSVCCDENSSMSWADTDNQDERQFPCTSPESDIVWKYFMQKQSHLLHIKWPSDMWGVWWNLPSFLNNAFVSSKVSNIPEDKQKQNLKLMEIAEISDNISAADYFSHLRPDAKINICSQPWYSSECDSSSEFENQNYYCRSLDVNDDISKALVVRSICNAQRSLQCDTELYVKPIEMSVQRDKDRVVSRHDSVSSHLCAAAVLDRRALALDYWSSCRSICRFEKAKTDTNSKRNNRFSHYLGSLKTVCKNDVFDKLAESLCPKDNNAQV